MSATGHSVGPALTLDDSPVGAAISPNGLFLAVTTTKGMTHVWDMTSGKAWQLPVSAKEAVQRTAFHPDGRIMLTQAQRRHRSHLGPVNQATEPISTLVRKPCQVRDLQ